jgi:pimeloyl-ACP methyl ester carboxylesterase
VFPFVTTPFYAVSTRATGLLRWVASRPPASTAGRRTSRPTRTIPRRRSSTAWCAPSANSVDSGERRITYRCHLGTVGNNTLTGSDLADTIRAFASNDRIGAGRGADDLDAGSGNDSITSDDESSLRRGARDTVRCGPGRDTVVDDPIACSLGIQPAAVEAKTLLLHGLRVPIAGPRHGRWLQERLPDARLEVVPDAGHLVLMPMWTALSRTSRRSMSVSGS